MNTCILTIIFVFILLGIVFIFSIKSQETFSGKPSFLHHIYDKHQNKKCIPVGQDNHCPRECSPFMYANMYAPRGNCSDPFSWGNLYTTGRCPALIQ